MKKVFFFLFFLAVSVTYGQSDRVFMFVKTTAPTDTVYMMRDDIDSILIESNCLLMAPSWIPKRDRMEQWNAPRRLNKNETFDVYYRHLNRWEPIMTKSIYSSFLFDKEIVVDTCSSFNEKRIFYHGLTFDDAREQIRQMVEDGKTSDLLLYGKDIIEDLIALLDDSTDTHIPMPHCNATYNYGDVALMSLLRIVRLPVCNWLNIEKESLYKHLHLHPEMRGKISTSNPLPSGYPIKDVHYVEGWGYYMPIGKDWYARFDEYPEDGTEVESLFQYGF